MRAARLQRRRLAQGMHFGAALLATISLCLGCFPNVALAAELPNRSIRMSNGEAGALDVEYNVQFNIPAASLIGSIRILFCSNTPLPSDPCTPPNGFDATLAVVGSQSGATGFLVSTTSTANDIILTRPPAMSGPVTAQYNIIHIDNPTDDVSFYARILTYSSSDGSGPHIDEGGIALDTEPDYDITAEVPPFIIFCVGESITAFNCSTATEAFSDVGDLTPNVTSAAQSQMLVATNANDGYIVVYTGTTMTAGNNIINPMAGTASVKGTSQFGLNLRANTVPIVGQNVQGPGTAAVTPGYDAPNIFRFTPGDTVVSGIEPNDFRKYTISYVINVPASQPGGVYATTLTYVALANF